MEYATIEKNGRASYVNPIRPFTDLSIHRGSTSRSVFLEYIYIRIYTHTHIYAIRARPLFPRDTFRGESRLCIPSGFARNEERDEAVGHASLVAGGGDLTEGGGGGGRGEGVGGGRGGGGGRVRSVSLVQTFTSYETGGELSVLGTGCR